MTSKFQSFDQSPMGAFIQSQLGARGIASSQSQLNIIAASSSNTNNGDSLTIYGEGFLSAQGSGFVVISENNDGSAPSETQTITSWTDTEIEITVVQGTLEDYSDLFIYVENNNGDSDFTGIIIFPGTQQFVGSVEEPDDSRFFEITGFLFEDSEITSPADGSVFNTSESISFSASVKSLVPAIYNSYPRFRFEGRTSGEEIDFRGWDWQPIGTTGNYESTDTGEDGLAQLFSDGALINISGSGMNLDNFTVGETVDIFMSGSPSFVDVSSDIEWRSSIDGVIGSGSSISTSSLSSGQHTIDARVEWSDHNGVDLLVASPDIDIDVGIGITSINPSEGGESGGTSVTITGFGYDGNTTVTFDGNAATNIVINSNTELTCDTPSGTAGDVDVVVSNGTDNDTLTDGFEYLEELTITNVSPSSGPTGSATSVTVTGTGFTAGTDVLFGGSSASNISLVSSTEITCDTPPRPVPGAVDVTVDDGTQSDTLTDGYTYT